jgi:hypothetical protein
VIPSLATGTIAVLAVAVAVAVVSSTWRASRSPRRDSRRHRLRAHDDVTILQDRRGHPGGGGDELIACPGRGEPTLVSCDSVSKRSAANRAADAGSGARETLWKRHSGRSSGRVGRCERGICVVGLLVLGFEVAVCPRPSKRWSCLASSRSAWSPCGLLGVDERGDEHRRDERRRGHPDPPEGHPATWPVVGRRLELSARLAHQPARCERRHVKI